MLRTANSMAEKWAEDERQGEWEYRRDQFQEEVDDAVQTAKEAFEGILDIIYDGDHTLTKGHIRTFEDAVDRAEAAARFYRKHTCGESPSRKD
jgi:hypothetical protein